MTVPLLELKALKKYFAIGKRQRLKAVDGISFSIRKGETFGLVGESGSGKSTLGRTVVGLYEPTGGSIFYEGRDIHTFDRKEKREFNRYMQIYSHVRSKRETRI